MADNLPIHLLPAASRAPFLSALQGAGFSLKQEKELAGLPVPTIRKTLANRQRLLGETLTRPECDGCLRLLSLALPRAGIAPADAHDMLDLYFGLLQNAGITGPMLRAACERYVMAPTNGKSKFFPDPGQIAEMCADEIKQRRRALAALDKAVALLEAPSAAQEASRGDPVGKQLHDLAERMRSVPSAMAMQEPQEVATAMVKTGRNHTDASELKAALARKLGHAA